MEILHTIFTSVITSGAFIAGISWFLKRYLDKRIEFIFNERIKVVEAKLKIAEKYEDHIFNVLVKVLPELQENVYRCRNKIKEIANNNEQVLIDNAIQYWSNLSEILFKYQIYLPEDTFINLHRFKRVSHGTIFLLSTALSSANIECNDTNLSMLQFVQADRIQIKCNIDELDKIYKFISSNIKEIMSSKTDLLR